MLGILATAGFIAAAAAGMAVFWRMGATFERWSVDAYGELDGQS